MNAGVGILMSLAGAITDSVNKKSNYKSLLKKHFYSVIAL